MKNGSVVIFFALRVRQAMFIPREVVLQMIMVAVVIFLKSRVSSSG